MKKYDLYGAFFWAGLAIYIILSASQMGLGKPRSPGPGFFPILVGFVLLFLSAFLATAAIRDKKKRREFNEWPSFYGNVFSNAAVLFAYSIILLPYLGFIISGFLLLAFFFAIPGGKKWWFSMLFSAFVVFITYYFFGVLLEAQFPRGILDIG